MEKPSELQQGEQEESLGQTEGPFPPQGSDVELGTALEIISAESYSQGNTLPLTTGIPVEHSQQ